MLTEEINSSPNPLFAIQRLQFLNMVLRLNSSGKPEISLLCLVSSSRYGIMLEALDNF